MTVDFAAELRRKARPLSGPGEEVLALSPADLDGLARRHDLSLRQVELLALGEEIVPERYLRNLGTLGWEGQRRLLESCVAVVGCGGLGGYVIEGLARSGVGRLVIVDGDRFVPHNINRQLFCTLSNLGRPKVEVAQERVAQINPAVDVVAHALRATAANLPALLAGAAVVVDALDNPPDRLALQAAAREAELPLVHGAIAGLVGQVTTVFPGDDTLDLLYGAAEEVPDHGAERLLGTPAVTPMLVAAYQVAEVLKVLLGQGQVWRGRLLYIDLETAMIEPFSLRDLEV